VTKKKDPATIVPRKKGPPFAKDLKFPHPGTLPIADVIEKAVQMLPSSALIPDQKSRAYLRWFAGLFYSSDLNAISIVQMSKHPLFQSVGYAQLSKWSSDDKWAEQREALFSRVQMQLQERVADEIVQKRVRELGELKRVSQKVLAKLLPEPHTFDPMVMYVKDNPHKVCRVCGNPEPGCNDPFWGVTGDKLVMAMSKLMELMLTLEGVVLSKMVKPEQTATSDPTAALEGVLSDADARVAAHAVLRRRNAPAADSEDGGEGDGAADAPDPSVESD
jgi:hypothetical protein